VSTEEVYSVQICPFPPLQHHVATTAGGSVAVGVLDPAAGTLRDLSHFTTRVASGDPEELFYALLWARLRDGQIVLVAGGFRGDIYILDTRLGILRMLRGHVRSVVCAHWFQLCAPQ
jgi:hypothetical protein